MLPALFTPLYVSNQPFAGLFSLALPLALPFALPFSLALRLALAFGLRFPLSFSLRLWCYTPSVTQIFNDI